MAERYTLRPPEYGEIDLGVWNAFLHPRDAFGRFTKDGNSGPSVSERASNAAYNPNAMDSFRMLVGNGRTTSEADYHEQMQHLAETHGKFNTDAEAYAAIDKASTISTLATTRIRRNGGLADAKTAHLVEQAQGLLNRAAVTLYHEHRAPIKEPKKGIEKTVDIVKDAGMTTLKEHAIGVVAGVSALGGSLFGPETADRIREMVSHLFEMSLGDAILAASLAAILGTIAAVIRRARSHAIRKARGEKVKPKEQPLPAPELSGLGISRKAQLR